MSNQPADRGSPPAPPKRPRRTGRILLFGILAAVLLAAAVTAIVYRDTLALLLYPDRIEVSRLPETLDALYALREKGAIRDLNIRNAEDGTEISYRSADDSVEVSAVYADDLVRSIEGSVWAARSSIQTIPDAEAFAANMLSPFFSQDETRAIFLKFTSDIVAQAGRDAMDMSLELGGRYSITVQGP
ncbi:MAG: hypothetical protein FWG93_06900, partial [Oscillospiraceae bacterium]|nr:hypothetical protein [Oscillospiraceae bacterium]